MRGPVHGYVITGVINDVIGPYAKASNGRLYPLLTRLATEGLVREYADLTTDGGRPARSFVITAAGKRRFRALMLDTASNPREQRDLFAFKVTAFEHITAGDRTTISTAYRQFAQDHVAHLTSQGSDIDQARTYQHTDRERSRFKSVFGHLTAIWRSEVLWADALLAEEATQ